MHHALTAQMPVPPDLNLIRRTGREQRYQSRLLTLIAILLAALLGLEAAQLLRLL